jgi:zinc transport system substrate-binding protein
VVEESVQCVLAEPQYNKGLVTAVVEGTGSNTAIIDPLGVGLEAGPFLYEKLIRKLAVNLSKCF